MSTQPPQDPNGIDWKKVRAAGRAEWDRSLQESHPVRDAATDMSIWLVYIAVGIIGALAGMALGNAFGGGTRALIGLAIGALVGTGVAKLGLVLLATRAKRH